MSWTPSRGDISTPSLWIAFYIVFGGLSLLAFLFTIPAEDAVILYEYAKNLADKGIISYGGSVAPIEGATDFLWMVLISAFSALGISEFASALLLNFFAIMSLAYYLKSNFARFALGIALLGTPYLYASLSGFSTIFFSAAYVLCIHLTLQRSQLLYVFVLLLCLIRPDGVIWAVGLVVYKIMTECSRSNWRSEARALLLSLIAPGILYFFWRAWYFSEFLPLPFLVKASGSRDLIVFFKDSIYSIIPVAAPLTFAMVVKFESRKVFVEPLIFFILPILFYASIRLEQNIGNRFMAPLFFGGFFWINSRLGIRALYIFLLPSLYFQAGSVVETALSVANSRNENIFFVAQELSKTNGRMLVTEAGRLAYYSNWFVEDSWGLNTPRFAHALVDVDSIAEGRYDLLVAHCDLLLLNPDAEHRHDKTRTWGNQCKEITSFIKSANYKVFLVPFHKSEMRIVDKVKNRFKSGSSSATASCKRHDIYAVSRGYCDAELVENILKRHGGFEYSASLNLPGGDVACP